MFEQLEEINRKPAAFELYTAASLWADEYRAKQMLAYHLNEDIDLSSRNTEFINKSAAWIIDKFKLGPEKSVCDYGCGPGLYASRFARAGAQVTGLDFSKNSIRYAQEQAAKAKQTINYIHADYLDFNPAERFNLITMIMCDFCALSPEQRKVILTVFYECLEDDGAILLDVYSMADFARREEVSFYEKNQLNHFWLEEDYYCFVNTFKYASEAVVLDKYSLFPDRGEPETIYNWLQFFSPESLTEELSAAGFAVQHIYKDVAGSPFADQHSEFAVIATKMP